MSQTLQEERLSAYNRAMSYFDAGDYQEALSIFDALLKRIPGQLDGRLGGYTVWSLALFQRAECLRLLARNEEAITAFHQLTRLEGIMPALESSHAVAYAMKLAAGMRPDQTVLVNLSGRGDKDVQTVAELEGISL